MAVFVWLFAIHQLRTQWRVLLTLGLVLYLVMCTISKCIPKELPIFIGHHVKHSLTRLDRYSVCRLFRRNAYV